VSDLQGHHHHSHSAEWGVLLGFMYAMQRADQDRRIQEDAAILRRARAIRVGHSLQGGPGYVSPEQHEVLILAVDVEAKVDGWRRYNDDHALRGLTTTVTWAVGIAVLVVCGVMGALVAWVVALGAASYCWNQLEMRRRRHNAGRAIIESIHSHSGQGSHSHPHTRMHRHYGDLEGPMY
jgi:hypothetical protein